jgi:hypothetical protein
MWRLLDRIPDWLACVLAVGGWMLVCLLMALEVTK